MADRLDWQSLNNQRTALRAGVARVAPEDSTLTKSGYIPKSTDECQEISRGNKSLKALKNQDEVIDPLGRARKVLRDEILVAFEREKCRQRDEGRELAAASVCVTALKALTDWSLQFPQELAIRQAIDILRNARAEHIIRSCGIIDLGPT
jgi:hypothetical protein